MCIVCLENIVMNEKWDSDHEDNLRIVKRREDKVGTLKLKCSVFYIPDFNFWCENFGGKTSLCLQLTASRLAHN